jgi:hypothetical protein
VRARLAVVGLLVVVASAAAAEPPPVITGNWIATAGAAQLRGQWSAQVLADDPDQAVGSWTLLSPTNVVTMQGTWMAKKAPKRWKGTWSARVQNGGSLSGTWEADASKLTGKTFADMLKATADKQIGGWWKSGAAHGNWWLQALPKPDGGPRDSASR